MPVRAKSLQITPKNFILKKPAASGQQVENHSSKLRPFVFSSTPSSKIPPFYPNPTLLFFCAAAPNLTTHLRCSLCMSEPQRGTLSLSQENMTMTTFVFHIFTISMHISFPCGLFKPT